MKTRGLICFYGLVCLAAAACCAAENLIENPGFANGVSEWQILSWKNKTRQWLEPVVDTKIYQGTADRQSMRLDWTEKHLCHLIYRDKIPFTGSQREFYMSYWCRSAGYEDYTTGQFSMVLEFPEMKGQKGYRISLQTPWNKLLTEWTFFQKKIQIPENVTYGKLVLQIHGYKNKKGTTWVDNLYLGKSPSTGK